jgi:hypothetical protein
MAKRRSSARLTGLSLEAIEDSITKVEKKIRSLRVTRGQQTEKDASLAFLHSLKALLRAWCLQKTGESRFIPFFLGK